MFFKLNNLLKICVVLLLFQNARTERVKRGSGGLPIELTKSDQNKIVQRHNDLRRSSKSSNMRYMTWDRELAMMSEKYGQKCEYKHNPSTEHSIYTSIGENIYASTGKVPNFVATSAVQMWFDEITDYNFDKRTCTPGKQCGHYTQVTWADSYKVGCSLVVCDVLGILNWKDAIIFICNYAPAGNVVKYSGERYPPFKIGTACSECQDQNDYCHNGLCANKERDKTDEFSDLVKEGYGGLVAVIVILVIILVILASYIFYRERHRVAVRVAFMKKDSYGKSKFSNTSTPVPSRPQTPRSSLTPGNLHGTNNELRHARVDNLIQENLPQKIASAPTTPSRGYLKGSPTRPAPILPKPQQQSRPNEC